MEDVNARQRFSFSCFWSWIKSFGIISEKITHIWQIEQGRIVAMKFETARIQVPSDFFAAVVVVLVSQALYYLSVWGKKCPILGSCICGDTNTLEIRRWPGLRTDPTVPPLSGSSLFTHSWVSRIPNSGNQSTWKWGCNRVTVSGEFSIIASRK